MQKTQESFVGYYIIVVAAIVVVLAGVKFITPILVPFSLSLGHFKDPVYPVSKA